MDLLRPITVESIVNYCKKIQIFDFTIISLLFIGLLYVFISNPSTDKALLLITSQISPCQHSPHLPFKFNMAIYKDELDEALAGASTENKTVIIAIVNKAYVKGDKPMLDLFLDGFWLGKDTQALIDHLLIVAVDQTSYERCRFLRLRCYKLETDGVDFAGEELYMSEDFIRMMWRRTAFLGEVLKRGYSFIFTDTDIIWLRNPFSQLGHNETIDFQFSIDAFKGDQWSEDQPINTGFYMVRSNNRTIAFFDSWYARKNDSKGLKEQDVLQQMMHEGAFKDLGLIVRYLNTLYFSGFCQDSKDAKAVITVHANCCRTISAKLTDLMAVIRRWKMFKSLPAKEAVGFGWSIPHSACIDSWTHG